MPTNVASTKWNVSLIILSTVRTVHPFCSMANTIPPLSANSVLLWQQCHRIHNCQTNTQEANRWHRVLKNISDFMYLRISEEVQVILWDIKHAFHYSSSAHRSFLRFSHGPRSVAGQEPEEAYVITQEKNETLFDYSHFCEGRYTDYPWNPKIIRPRMTI